MTKNYVKGVNGKYFSSNPKDWKYIDDKFCPLQVWPGAQISCNLT